MKQDDDTHNMLISVQFSCSAVYDSLYPIDCSTSGSSVLHHLLEFAQTHVIELVMPSNHLILCHPFFLLPSIFPRPESFQMSQFFTSGGQSIGVSASASVLPVNIQDWFPLGWTGWISLLKTYKLEEKLYSMEILGSPREVLFLMFKEGEVYNLRPGAV